MTTFNQAIKFVPGRPCRAAAYYWRYAIEIPALPKIFPDSLPGKDVEIRYPHGVAGLVKEVDRAKSGPEVGRNDREAGR